MLSIKELLLRNSYRVIRLVRMIVCSVDEGHLIIFDRSKDKTWEERIWHKPCQYQDKTIIVWGM